MPRPPSPTPRTAPSPSAPTAAPVAGGEPHGRRRGHVRGRRHLVPRAGRHRHPAPFRSRDMHVTAPVRVVYVINEPNRRGFALRHARRASGERRGVVRHRAVRRGLGVDHHHARSPARAACSGGSPRCRCASRRGATSTAISGCSPDLWTDAACPALCPSPTRHRSTAPCPPRSRPAPATATSASTCTCRSVACAAATATSTPTRPTNSAAPSAPTTRVRRSPRSPSQRDARGCRRAGPTGVDRVLRRRHADDAARDRPRRHARRGARRPSASHPAPR